MMMPDTPHESLLKQEVVSLRAEVNVLKEQLRQHSHTLRFKVDARERKLFNKSSERPDSAQL